MDFLPSDKHGFAWRREYLPDLQECEKDQMEDIFWRLHGYDIRLGHVTFTLAWSYYFWSRRATPINWVAYGVFTLQQQAKRVASGASKKGLREDWLNFEASRASGSPYTGQIMPPLLMVTGDVSGATAVGTASALLPAPTASPSMGSNLPPSKVGSSAMQVSPTAQVDSDRPVPLSQLSQNHVAPSHHEAALAQAEAALAKALAEVTTARTNLCAAKAAGALPAQLELFRSRVEIACKKWMARDEAVKIIAELQGDMADSPPSVKSIHTGGLRQEAGDIQPPSSPQHS